MIEADDDEVVQVAQPLPAPMKPSKAQREAHECTHLPYRSWCPHCVAARRSNSQHRRSSSSNRTLPLLVADYCRLKDTDDGIEGITVHVARLYPARALLATVVDAKGPDDNAVARVANFIRDSGHSKMVYKQTRKPQSDPCLRKLSEDPRGKAASTMQDLSSLPPRLRLSASLSPTVRPKTQYSALRIWYALIKPLLSPGLSVGFLLGIRS